VLPFMLNVSHGMNAGQTRKEGPQHLGQEDVACGGKGMMSWVWV
jgi:hypothetical protein